MDNSTNVSSLPGPSPPQKDSDIFSAAVYAHLVVVFKFLLFPMVGVSALFANIINVLVFYKMGLSDGVTQNYFILSISEGAFALLNVINIVAYIFVTLAGTYKSYKYFEEGSQIVYYFSYFLFMFPQLVYLFTTVVIAVVRSCCVAMLLQVKHILTRQRQLAAILLLSGIGVFLYAYSLAPLYVVKRFNPRTNRTIVFFDGLTGHILVPLLNISFTGGFFIVVISVFVMARGLRQASKFRGSSTSGQTTSRSNKETNTNVDSSTQSKATDRQQRDVRIVRTVVLVSVVFIVTNIPVITFNLVRIFIEEFNPGGRYRNAYQFGRMVREFSTMFNAAVNIFIYFFYNTRFRVTLSSLIGCGEK